MTCVHLKNIFSLISEYTDKPAEFNINCVDPLNRSALIAAIENENIELIRLLLEAGIQVKDALLHAISEEYVEAVETLLYYEETNHEPGKPYVSSNPFYISFMVELWPILNAMTHAKLDSNSIFCLPFAWQTSNGRNDGITTYICVRVLVCSELGSHR